MTDHTEKLNTGHGWVRPRPDGMKARCGGPAICRECAVEAGKPLPTPPDPNEIVTVNEFLYDGDLVGTMSGNMVGLYRVRIDSVKGEAHLEFEGLAKLTGAHNTVRRMKP